MLSRQNLNEVITIIAPHMAEEKTRHAIVAAAFIGTPLQTSIDFSGTAHQFTTHLISQANLYGEIENGGLALEVLLSEFKKYVGADKQETIDQLITQVNNSRSTVEKKGFENPIQPPIPSLFLGRDHDVHMIKSRLGIESNHQRYPVTVIHGWPGIGKTTFVNALLYDTEIQTVFPDGILWIAIGQDPTIDDEIRALARTLRVYDASDPSVSLEKLFSQMQAVLAQNRTLLIVDDIWDADHAHYFKLVDSTSSSCVIFTTRFPVIAEELIDRSDKPYNLPQLHIDSGREILRAYAPKFVEKYDDEATKLVEDLEALPLALQVAGKTIASQLRRRLPIDAILKSLQDSSMILDTRANSRFNHATGTTPTIRLLFEQSTNLLDKETRTRFAELSILAPKPATFDLDDMRGIWETDPIPIVNSLIDYGLLEVVGDRYRMHALLVKHGDELLDEMDDA